MLAPSIPAGTIADQSRSPPWRRDAQGFCRRTRRPTGGSDERRLFAVLHVPPEASPVRIKLGRDPEPGRLEFARQSANSVQLKEYSLGLARRPDRLHPGEPRAAQRALARDLPAGGRKLSRHRRTGGVAQYFAPDHHATV